MKAERMLIVLLALLFAATLAGPAPAVASDDVNGDVHLILDDEDVFVEIGLDDGLLDLFLDAEALLDDSSSSLEDTMPESPACMTPVLAPGNPLIPTPACRDLIVFFEEDD
ncbi:MAG: hypothetical protein HZC54_14775 [Verrucomicrobia bacterium]|nr:hypothetical protein [Verrucomicrobiota bacterium]